MSPLQDSDVILAILTRGAALRSALGYNISRRWRLDPRYRNRERMPDATSQSATQGCVDCSKCCRRQELMNSRIAQIASGLARPLLRTRVAGLERLCLVHADCIIAV